MGFYQDHDLGNRIDLAYGSDSVAVTAGGAGDAVQVTSQSFDRFAVNEPLSMVAAIRYKAVLAAAATLSLAYVVEHSDDNATFVTLTAATGSTGASAVVATGPAGGGTVRGVVQIPLDLAGAKEYVRLKFTPDLSAANTDTAEISALFVLGGQRILPV